MTTVTANSSGYCFMNFSQIQPTVTSGGVTYSYDHTDAYCGSQSYSGNSSGTGFSGPCGTSGQTINWSANAVYKHNTSIYNLSLGSGSVYIPYPIGPPPAPSAPTSLSVLDGTNPSLTWPAVAGGSGYSISYEISSSTSPNGSFTVLGTTSSTSYSDTNSGTARPLTYRVRTVAVGDGNSYSGTTYSGYTTKTSNSPPNAPTITSPPASNDAVLTNGQPYTFTEVFSDNDSGDSQSQVNWRIRQVNVTPTPAWTITTLNQPGGSHDFTFTTNGNYEAQAATRDSQGAPAADSALAWCGSVYFSVASPSAAPAITSPTNGSNIGTSSIEVDVSFPAGDGLRYRVVDAATGNDIVPLTTVTDPAAVAARKFTISGLANNTSIKILVAIRNNNLWTSYAESDNQITYTPPPAPTFTVAPVSTLDPTLRDALLVTVTTPAPASGSPPATSVDISASPDGGKTVEWRRTGQSINGQLTFDVPASDVDYAFQAVAHADNGTTSSTGWVT